MNRTRTPKGWHLAAQVYQYACQHKHGRQVGFRSPKDLHLAVQVHNQSIPEYFEAKIKLKSKSKLILFKNNVFTEQYKKNVCTVLFCKERSAENKGIDFPLRKVNKRKSLNKKECARTLWRFIYLYIYYYYCSKRLHIHINMYTHIHAHI